MVYSEKERERAEIFTYLDALRESGTMNMDGAPKVLQERFDLDKKAALDLFLEWAKQG